VVSFGFVPQGSFSNLSLKLFNSTTASYVNPASGVPLTTSTTFAGLQTGNNYQFEISGLATSSVSSYVGTATVSAVPLPAALPLFGAALAILGLAIRRKASQGVSARFNEETAWSIRARCASSFALCGFVVSSDKVYRAAAQRHLKRAQASRTT